MHATISTNLSSISREVMLNRAHRTILLADLRVRVPARSS